MTEKAFELDAILSKYSSNPRLGASRPAQDRGVCKRAYHRLNPCHTLVGRTQPEVLASLPSLA